MIDLVLDIETVPRPLAELEAMMPESVRNPVLPPELESPVFPDFSVDCPDYGLKSAEAKFAELSAMLEPPEAATLRVLMVADPDPDAKAEEKRLKALESARVKAEAATDKRQKAIVAAHEKVEEAKGKRQKWIEDRTQKARDEVEARKEKFREGALNARVSFIDRAALDARLGMVKAVGLRNVSAGWTRLFLAEPDPATVKKVRTWFLSLPDAKREDLPDARIFRDRALILSAYRSEADMMKAFLMAFMEEMEPDQLADGKDPGPYIEKGQCVTYYGNSFDFPFMFRRAWILGIPQVPLYLRGRYFDSARLVDLHDVWTMGVRDEKPGGLESMARALGSKDLKTGDGKTFFRWYAEDPVEGLCYLIGDLDKTEFSGQRMGVIQS